ncbi:MAG: hypothetical protein LBD21_08625 [Tannerellaceae bacterium]|nr:hypothetical protein [Tannerellaceae bacterium]
MDETRDRLRKAGKNHTMLNIYEMLTGRLLRLKLRLPVKSLRSLPPRRVTRVASSHRGRL